MQAQVLTISPAEPREGRVRRVVDVLGSGGVVALPTETFYGLAADAFNADAVARVNAMKGKPSQSPVLLLIGELEQARRLSTELPRGFAALAERFWPGPLTLVVPASAEVPAIVTGGTGTVGFRIPGVALPRRTAGMLGGPITGVSANLHGEPPCRTSLEVAEAFADGVDMIVDGGATPGGVSSTVLDLTGSQARILREGAVPRAALATFLPELA